MCQLDLLELMLMKLLGHATLCCRLIEICLVIKMINWANPSSFGGCLKCTVFKTNALLRVLAILNNSQQL